MSFKTLNYPVLLLLHVLLAVAVFVSPLFSKLYGILVPIFGLILLFNTKNQQNQVLLIVSYIVTSEVFLRMTDGNILHEIVKYEVIFFMLLGMVFSGFSNKGLIYLFFMILLVPGIFIGANELSLDTDVRKAIVFNILGEVALFVSAMYCFHKTITKNQLEYIIKALSLPIVSLVTYLFLYTPSIKDVVTGTQSNFETSGGFGPNQVSTMLGLGMFCFFVLTAFFSKSKLLLIIHTLLLAFVSYRAIVTFSRGGVITGVVMIAFFLLITYYFSNQAVRNRVVVLIVSSVILGGAVWAYSVVQTSGLIENRYANKDARGREKEDKLGGRERIASSEIQMFYDNPLFGIGVGRNKEYREQTTGIEAASHNEMTRLLAEHGSLGLTALLMLLLVPISFNFQNKTSLFLFAFYIFWLLTINHAAMRIAAPSFVYALALLKLNFSADETTLPREQTE